MKPLTVRLPEVLIAQIEAESRRRKLSKSDVVRERLIAAGRSRERQPATLDAIADLVGSVDRLPRDLSARTMKYLIRHRR
jgi:Arc/MetJ-type ribon-helix-helix transcriptional regulator